MSKPETPLFNPDSEPEEEPLGLKEPLGIIQRFIVPLGANSLTVLDPSIFLRGEIQEDSFRSSVQDSPRFQESAPVMQGRVQLGQGQTVDQPNAENALGETIQRQEFEIETPSSSLHSPPSPPKLGGSDPQNPLRLRRSELQSPPELGDLGGECNVFSTFQTTSEVAQSASDSLESSDQSVPLPEKPSTKPQSVEDLLTDSVSTTVQTKKTEASEMGKPSEVVQVRSPSTDQRTTRSASQNIPNANVNLQRSSITASEENQTQSPTNLEDLGFDASAQTNVGDRKGLDIAQTSTEKEVDRGNAEMIVRSQASDPATSPNIDQPIQQQALPSFPEVNPTHPNPIVQAQTYESKIIDAPFDPLIDSPVSSGDPPQSPVAPPSSSLDSSRSAPLAVNPNLPILGVTARDRANEAFEAIESTNFRAPIADPTIQQSRSDSVVKGEVYTSESTESMSKEPFVPSELSSFQQSIEVGESTPEATVLRSPQPQETSDAIALQVTPHTETNLEATLLQPRLIDSASVESESSILPESPKITSREIEPSTPLPTDLQADTKRIEAQKSAKAKTSAKTKPKSLLSKTIQFLSKAAGSIVTTPKRQPSSEASRQIQSSPVQTDSIQQFEERPSQSSQIQEEPTLSSFPMIAESSLIQPETRLPDAKTPIQQSTRIESRSTETPIQRSIQLEEQWPEAETPIHSFVQAEGQLPEVESIERIVQSEARLPETPIQRSIKTDEQSSEALIQPSVQAEGRSPEAEEFSEPSIQPETLIPHSVQADDLFSEIGTSIQRSDQPETQSTELPIQQLLQSETGSTEIEIPPQQVTQPEIRSPETDFTIQQPVQPETPIQRSIQVEGQSQLETFIEPSVQPEMQSAEAENPVQQSAQVKTQSAETFIEESGQAKGQLPETETPIQRSIQTEEQSREPETPIQSSVQPETRSPETEIPMQRSIQVEGRSSETLIQQSIQAEDLLLETEPPFHHSAQSETQSPETSIEQIVQPEMRSPDTSIQRSVQPEERSPEIPIQPSIQPETSLAEVEPSIQETVHTDGRSPTTDSPIQRIVQPPIHETIQPQQFPSPLSQPENELASELIASDTEKVQPISPSELAIARETTSEPLAETAITPYSEFPQLPSVLQNLSILKPLAQNTVQKIPEQSYPSSYPPTVEGKQTQSPSIPSDLGSQRRELAIPQISPQEPIATDSIITVQKSPTQYTKIDIPPRKAKTAEVRSQSTPSIAIAPKTTLQSKRQNPSGVIQMVRDQTLIPEGKEETLMETDTSASDIAQDLETLAQTIYAQLQQRLRIDRERRGPGTGRFPW